MAKIKLSQMLFGLDDNPIADSSGKSLTIRTVLINALLASSPDENIEGVEKLKRFDQAKKFQKDKEVEFTNEYATHLLERVNKIYGTLVYSRAYEILVHD